MSTLDVYSQQGKKIDKIALNSKVFDKKINPTLIHQVVVTYLANKRSGVANTLTRGQVRGGGRKPWRQKGTGRARVGSLRSPLWRGGGVTFGPQPRSYSKKINQRVKVLALKSALNAKLESKEIMIIDKLKIESFKTKNLFTILKKLKLDNQKVKIVVEKIEPNLKMASQNLAYCNIDKAQGLNTLGVLDCKKLIFTLVAFKVIEERITKWLS